MNLTRILSCNAVLTSPCINSALDPFSLPGSESKARKSADLILVIYSLRASYLGRAVVGGAASGIDPLGRVLKSLMRAKAKG